MAYPASRLDVMMDDWKTGNYGHDIAYTKPEPLYECEECGKGIYKGDDCLNTKDCGCYCRDCVMKMSADLLMEVCGYGFTKAYN